MSGVADLLCTLVLVGMILLASGLLLLAECLAELFRRPGRKEPPDNA